MTQPTLILVPGLMCDDTSWGPVLPALSAHMPCQVVSHGNADSLVTMAQQILDNAPAQFNLAGHSMGGRVALEVLRLAPERVLRLGLLGTGFLPKEAGVAGEEVVKKRQALLDIEHHQGIRQMALTWVQNMVAPSRLNEAALIEDIVQRFERKSEDIFQRQIKALLERPDASDVLAEVQVPTLVMAGEFDAWASPQQHQQIADLVPARPTVDVVVGAGHMMMMEKPEAVTARFLSWLTSA
jgi:pimeloyl-ACP methyl ester carboxylesterase